MLDISLLRNHLNEIAIKLSYKNYQLDQDYFNKLETKRKQLQIKTEEIQSQRNNYSKQVGGLKAKGADATIIIQIVAQLTQEFTQLNSELEALQTELNSYLSTIPNLPDSSVVKGDSELDNVEIRRFGLAREFDFTIKDHVDLGIGLNHQLDLELGVKIAGPRFYIIKAQLAKLHRVLAQFMLNTHIEKHGYQEIYVPYLVNRDSLFATGQLPKFEDDLFKIKHNNKDFYLIPTAEVSLTNMVREQILKINELPLKYVCHSPCFRSEAGSYGRDTKGIIRVHQFDKVEMVQIVEPQNSYTALEEMVHHAENILQKLGLPYRVVSLCGADLGFCAAKTYDLEVWLPSQNTYREISSCSNMTDFQARRMKARYKNKLGKNELVHTLNGSGLAVGRALVAILENYQNSDGSITVPEILVPLMGVHKIL